MPGSTKNDQIWANSATPKIWKVIVIVEQTVFNSMLC